VWKIDNYIKLLGWRLAGRAIMHLPASGLIGIAGTSKKEKSIARLQSFMGRVRIAINLSLPEKHLIAGAVSLPASKSAPRRDL